MEEKKEKKEVKATRSNTIWNKIENLKLNIYGLPNQVLKDHAKRFEITDDDVHLVLKAQAILPALEEALAGISAPKGQRYVVSQTNKFTIVSLDSSDE